MDWMKLAEKSLAGTALTEAEARSVLRSPDDDLLPLVHAAFQVRQSSFGKRVKLNFLLNAKSGLCPEDCNYCSQSKISDAGIEKYPFLSETEILEAAGRAVETRAKRFCMVNSGRGPTDGEVDQISSAVRKVRQSYPQLEICVCLGLLESRQAKELKDAGVHAYNHNLNASENYYSSICSTHAYQDRIDTVNVAREQGLSSCSGCLFGMGEKEDDIIQLAYTLRKMNVDSIPINFLIPIEGTPLSATPGLTPQTCLKILCLFRFLNPKSEIRIAGGREVQLRWLQPLGLFVANSIFIGDYLTTQGQKPEADLSMIRDLGFEIEGSPDTPALQGRSQPEEFAVRLK
ncbi:MAG: biotin synthase BioB [Elusimicrobia bacterium RIFCSPLOWO2_01_FULL_54_10]|nr:MAG: biotin synthase BioB [Elusimicrobia bacterium RIFCSPLOWO2_01_FULL_54_10]